MVLSISAQDTGSMSFPNFETEEVRLIDLTTDTVMYTILKDATDKIRYGNRPAYYSVILNRYKKGTIVRIIRSYSDVFDARLDILGYVKVNGNLIVFFKGLSDYELKYSQKSCNKSIRKGNFDYGKDSSDIKFYYILQDIFAKFSQEAGWIWSDGKPDE